MPSRGRIPMVWVLIDPDGGRHKVYDLAGWIRQNIKLFFPDDVPESAVSRVCCGFQAIAKGLREPDRKYKAKTYKKWTLAEPPRPRIDEDTEDSFERASQWVSIGDRFGALTIVDTAPKKVYAGNTEVAWKVYCRFCGEIKVMSYGSIVVSKSCGCLRNVLRPRLCRICWNTFSGKGKEIYCPECRSKHKSNRKKFQTARPEWVKDPPSTPPFLWEPKEDLSGRNFGKWHVICPAKRKNCYLCQCKCGALKSVYYGSLRHGTSTQCQKCANALNRKQIKRKK